MFSSMLLADGCVRNYYSCLQMLNHCLLFYEVLSLCKSSNNKPKQTATRVDSNGFDLGHIFYQPAGAFKR